MTVVWNSEDPSQLYELEPGDSDKDKTIQHVADTVQDLDPHLEINSHQKILSEWVT